ncbi:MAG: DNA helicase RecQ [Clostridia bacterium]|nr:DNA helicase RecQ [Clostridia bacterium]
MGEAMSDKKTVLKQYFGHTSFRPGQEQVVDAILQRRDALCVMPTGAGKSVCYQVPALLFDGITLVISPLISLMKDQVNALTQNGIRAAYLNSSLTTAQYFQVIERMRMGAYKIVYVAPERLAVTEFTDVCRDVRVDLLAVDEAHCVSQWGQDFRPSYLKIAEFIGSLGYRPTVAAFTATATAEVKDDVERALRLRDPFRITTGFDRPNLKFEVIRTKKKSETLLSLLKKRKKDAGIVYCSTRKAVEEVGERLCEAGFSATVYHAGLSDETRKRNQEDFVYDRKSVMVATNAFGMGIDKSNVSYVIHYNMPKDVESYYQEAGRAGRDGSRADCILLYSPADVHTNQFLIERAEPNPELTPEEWELLKARDYERLKQMTFYSTCNTCLRSFILNYFGEKSANYCGNCSNCLTQFREVDITVEAQKILSCIKRTGERFGKKMICDILRGSKNEKLLRLGLDSQTTYGLMKEYREPQVREMIDYLEFEGYIASDGGEYPTLSVAPKARAILFGQETLSMKQAKPKEIDVEKIKKEKIEEAVDADLLEGLKTLRRELAEAKNVPPYVVFSNATLMDMCKRLPVTDEEFLEVSGVGKVKLALYGKPFLQLLRLYCVRKATPDGL